MFRGHFEHAVDQKGRVAVPAPFREALSALPDERLVVTKFMLGGKRCLDAYPLASWRTLEEKVLAKERFDPKMMAFRNVYISGAAEVACDGQGRILLPPTLRQYAGIAEAATIVGDVDKFRIWDRQSWHGLFEEQERLVFDDPHFLADLDI
ncbi:MAG: division/cell wall cluster transcriptional repressor MraZ [bacterium]|nr:division/cell wall cluster transcriptional repressor MraZ [bacterium]